MSSTEAPAIMGIWLLLASIQEQRVISFENVPRKSPSTTPTQWWNYGTSYQCRADPCGSEADINPCPGDPPRRLRKAGFSIIERPAF
ncbi:uncharacterized protein GGS25DRAFT_522285 [Hypoxylon fragiforme]|uniref:uncharacterized protein n=1 Tax=Hypoxylon fragiforme TaxID=63214 RepID=UPI0020C71726|nr:uncharacterized protein GGS25DRAFT_522285 [Hypoxylon fragiforme]KAI2609106.1 hypothetical protein GGS25DRAFT_522285 [Hypoxylon fragiforme]